jgi:hypothetical protein
MEGSRRIRNACFMAIMIDSDAMLVTTTMMRKRPTTRIPKRVVKI